MPKPKMPGLSKLVADILKHNTALNNEQCPFIYHQHKGNPNVVLIVGGNVSGKSYLADTVNATAYHRHGVAPMVVSMKARTAGDMAGAFVYGIEDGFATSHVSIGAALKAVSNIEKRMQGEQGFGLAVLDEPDIGLSEDYAYAFGHEIGGRLTKLPNQGWGLVLVTHSREMVRGLRDGLNGDPTMVHSGDKDMTMDTWLEKPKRRSVAELLAISDRNIHRFRVMSKLLDTIKTERETEEANKKRGKKRGLKG